MPSKKSNPLKTVLTICVGFIIVYMITGKEWALIVALSTGSIGLISSAAANLIDFLWLKLSDVLGMIVPNILLSIIFYFCLFPIAMISRLFGKKDPLQLKNTTSGTWTGAERIFDRAYFEKTW